MKSKFFEYAGVLASVILVAFGAAAIIMGMSGRSEVSTNLKREQISGSPDMTPALINKAIADAGLKNVEGVPTCSVAGKSVDTGSEARCFAQYMRIHALEATGGRPYAEMARFVTADGKETNDEAQAAKDPKTDKPVANGARNTWVTATALSTALNTSYFAQQVALFSIIMGIALLLTGIGFLVLTIRWLRDPAKAPRRMPGTAPVAGAA